MTDGSSAAERDGNPWVQAIMALVLVGGVVGYGLWHLLGPGSAAASTAELPAATCTPSSPTPRDRAPSGHVSGDQLCTALNRPDLAALLGVPGEKAETADGGDSSFRPAGAKTEIRTPESTVRFATYAVQVSATYDRLSVTEAHELFGDDSELRTVLGRPATLSSTPTFSIDFGAPKGTAAGPNGTARTLTVAMDPKDKGGSYEISLWREDAVPPDDAALLRVAERVLPTIPGWRAG
ncbi:DUF6215 domain-containing protein [Streptomyces sp. NPDC048182]|uniref:DUF6215 domain-containing protein n=1 Tax=Streptomyces sp. NPDC048182 TaxID=3365507 RepID=UPI00371E21DC